MGFVIISQRQTKSVTVVSAMKPGFVLSAVATAACVLMLDHIDLVGELPEPEVALFVGCLLVMFASGLTLGLFTRPIWPIPLFGLGGITVAVVANTVYDYFANYIDRNLFPFEIVFHATLLMPGLMVGVAGSVAMNRWRRR